MRLAVVLSFLMIAQIGFGVSASKSASEPAPAVTTHRPLILIPTMLQELHELRVNTGERAVLRDGTMSPVYVTKVPSAGNTYLNFHVDAASEGGSFVLQSEGIRLEGVAASASIPRSDVPTGKTVSDTPMTVAYTPMDWFIDTGNEVRGDPLTVNEKAIVQFTIEVPQAGFDALVLFVHSQRIGTVKEVRERIAKDSGVE